jgi:hypothetical protein
MSYSGRTHCTVEVFVANMKEPSRTIATSREIIVETYILFGGGMAIGLAIAIWGIWNLK